MIHVGFTGTRHGMTKPQRTTVERFIAFLFKLDELMAHHGDCVGADAEFHAIAEHAIGRLKITIHPPVDEKLRAFCNGYRVRDPLPFLLRNRIIVGEADVMIAAPAEAMPQPRGGTWTTVRYARERHCQLALVLPSGELELYNNSEGR